MAFRMVSGSERLFSLEDPVTMNQSVALEHAHVWVRPIVYPQSARNAPSEQPEDGPGRQLYNREYQAVEDNRAVVSPPFSLCRANRCVTTEVRGVVSEMRVRVHVRVRVLSPALELPQLKLEGYQHCQKDRELVAKERAHEYMYTVSP